MGAINYIWDEENDSLLEEVDDDGNVIASYTNEPGPFGKVISQERNGVTSYYHYDGQGSTVALTDDNENVTDTYVYTAFGELVSSTGTTVNPFRYVGQYGYYTDVETNDIYIRARSYTPSLGRWLTRDPIGFEGSPFNLYDFVDSKPVFKTDPSGQSVCDGYDDYDDPSPCFNQSICWVRFPRLPYLPWPLPEDDKYPSQAKKCCEAFGRLYGRNPSVQCVGDCLITHEQCCQKKIGCDDRQRCRAAAHVDCYAKCLFVPYLGLPWDCLVIADDVLNL